ncbi:MAG: response regulator, partial [Planctomycetota bacterium]
MRAKMHILIVDDEPLIVSSLSEFLTKCGHELLTANSVNQALNEIENARGRLDLIITDVCMPVANGVTLLEQARDRYPEVDIILLTAFAESMNAKLALRKGAAAFIRKPVAFHELEHIVQQVAEKRIVRGQLIQTEINYRESRKRHEQFVRERKFLRRLHRRLLPTNFDWLRRSQLYLRQMCMAGVGGDYVDVRPYGKAQALLFIADVAGHGLIASFMCSALKTWFLSLRLRLKPEVILKQAEQILKDLLPDEFLATACCCIYNERDSTLTW